MHVGLHDLQYQRLSIRESDLYKISQFASANGVTHATQNWFVSKYTLSTTMDLAKKAASFLVEGTIDLGNWFGTCDAGNNLYKLRLILYKLRLIYK
jgi:hypothetical protein